MEKGPFSLYDFIGYFIPGALVLYLVFFWIDVDPKYFSDKFYLNNEKKNSEIPLYMITFYVIIAYCLGHFLSFFSTLTVEKYTVRFYGYPSRNLLAINEEKRTTIGMSAITRENIIKNFSLIFILPLIIFDSILYILKYKHKYLEQIFKPYRELISNKINKVFRRIGYVGNVVDISDNNYHQFLIHYNYEYTQEHSFKLMNYVAIYGFLRVITLISSTYLYYLIFYFCINYSIELSFEALIGAFIIFGKLFFFGLITFIFYLGYLKFYKRYTLENLMLVLILKKP
jgi:hypothetical protein